MRNEREHPQGDHAKCEVIQSGRRSAVGLTEEVASEEQRERLRHSREQVIHNETPRKSENRATVPKS